MYFFNFGRFPEACQVSKWSFGTLEARPDSCLVSKCSFTKPEAGPDSEFRRRVRVWVNFDFNLLLRRTIFWKNEVIFLNAVFPK